jgi:hypothetical protein
VPYHWLCPCTRWYCRKSAGKKVIICVFLLHGNDILFENDWHFYIYFSISLTSLPIYWKPCNWLTLFASNLFLFLTISYLFSIPKNCSNLKFNCPLEVLHLEKLEKIFFQVGKKIVLLGKIFFLVGNFFFTFFHTKREEKLKKIFCYHNCPDLSLFE